MMFGILMSNASTIICPTGMNELQIISELPSSLALDMCLFLYRDMICKVSLFEEAEIGFIRCLVTRLRPQLFPAMEYIVRKEDIGREMFFIQRGACEVLEEDTGHVIFELKQGGFFGEIALITAERRSASVRTAVDCNILVLTKVRALVIVAVRQTGALNWIALTHALTPTLR